MNQYIAKIAALDWLKVVGVGLALAVGYYFLMYNDGTALSEGITAANTRLQTATRQLGETEKALSDAARFETEVTSLGRQFDKIVDFMPATVTSADLTTIINKQIQLAGVRAVSIKPSSEIQRVSFYETSRVDLELSGSFAQIVTFLSYMSRVPRLLTFEGTNLTLSQENGDNSSSVLLFKTTLVGYRYLKDAPVAAPTPNPDGSMPAAPAPTGAVN